MQNMWNSKKKQQEEKEAKQIALSMKKQDILSKQQAKTKLVEADKRARQAHRRVML